MSRELLSATRMLQRCEALAALTEEDGRLTRTFLSPQQRAASALVIEWMEAAGMAARTDAIGNVTGRYEGLEPGRPCLLLGSHLDTVRDAGRYDGMLGVVAAIECVAALHGRSKRLPFAVEVVGFSDEEGVRFGSTLLGSRALAGTFQADVLEKTGKDGISMREAMGRAGLDPAAIPTAARRRADVLAYVELHIEQGPVLENEGLPVGVVTAINGATRLAVEIKGMAGHAGTVPMSLRQDALAAAAECIVEIERICRETPELVGTVGQIEARPGATNVIPGIARFTVDVRSPRDAERAAAVENIKAAAKRIGTRRKAEVAISKTHEGGTAACAPWLMQQLGAAIQAEGLPVRQLPSGAGHDGMAMVDLTDIGMLFVRCERGISHHPAEAVTPADVETGARVLLRFIENFRAHGGKN
jgi:allantoate deiminase